MVAHSDFAPMLKREGYALLPDVISSRWIARITDALPSAADMSTLRQRGGATYAMRNLLSAAPCIRELAASTEVRELVDAVLGTEARVVRGLLFDKTPDANWKVAWHQDLSIAVRQRIEVPGFGPWSSKAGVTHVQPPVTVLENMVTVRLHLDDCGPDNGPLRVLPGSHADGVLAPAAIERWTRDVAPAECHVGAGGAVLIRPLLLHASATALRPEHRRVVHLEFASGPLPGGLEWFEA